MDSMFVMKRNGNMEAVHFDKITERISKLIDNNERKYVDPVIIAQKTVASIYNGITTEELDLESAKICVNLCTTHYLYSSIASRILVSNLHKKTLNSFVDKENLIQEKLDFLDVNWLKWINENKNEIENMIDYSRDYIYDYFGFKTLENAYLIKINNKIIERPQDMLMRVASFINKGDLELTKKTYDLMSQGYYTQASPTLFNSGNKRSQLSSCFEGNTLVNTLRGSIPIKDVEIGDEVVTHLGNVKKVIQKHKNKINERKLYQVKFCRDIKTDCINKNGFIVTEDHKLFTYDINTELVSWTEIKNLTSNNFVMVPNNKEIKDQIKCNYLNENIIQLDKLIFVRFLSKDEVNINDEYVYTLGVEDDHSYSIEGIVAQNCFLLGTDDSLEGITKTWADVSKISKWGGGIGIHVSNIRARDSLIRGTNGPSSGIIPMLKVYNEIARYVNQCFIGSTKIYTDNGLIPINKIKPHNKVFTIDGTLQNVKRVYCDYYDGTILNFTFNNNYENNISKSHHFYEYDNIKVTPTHPFYVIKNQPPGTEYDIIKKKLDNKYIIPEWIDAKDITINDLIGIPIPKYVKDNEYLDEADCYIYGLLLSNGFIFNDKCGFLLNYNNKYQIDFIIEYLNKYGIQFEKYKTDYNSEYSISWTHTSKFKFVESQLYNNNSEKYFDNMILNLPENKLKFVFKGFIDVNININQNYITITENNINLIDGIKYILLKMGYICFGTPCLNSENLYLNIPIDDKMKKILDIDNLDLNNSILNYFNHNDILYIRIKSVIEEQISTNVYDLEIENNHNYLTQAGLVHNGGKRKGSIVIYLEPHHYDIKAFLELRKNTGAETERTRDLFTALWVSDLFMKQVEINGDWYLMCPDICKGLTDVYGSDYEEIYWSYVKENKYKEKVKARDIWQLILESQVETGTPYIVFKDSVNRKSNQKNIGVIKSSNLCAEILEYSDDKEYAVCNLASIAINKFVEPFVFNKDDEWIIYSKENCKYCTYTKTFLTNKGINYLEIKNKLPVNAKTYPQIYHNGTHIGGYDDLFDYVKGTFNYQKLYDTAYIATKNLNKIIDINYYPVPETKLSNMKHRPVGLGIQGLADALVLLKIPYDSDDSVNFNKKIMETIYLAAITSSHDVAKEPNVGPYETFKGSPISEGKFQFDLWNINRDELMYKEKWEQLTESIKKYGVRNSLVTALMPTASTSQILGNNECFEFFTNNIYTRRTLAGDFPLVNKYLIDELYDLNMWSNEMKQMIIANNGSIANFTDIPSKIRRLYQTIWEIKQVWTLKNAVARGPFVDQTQSMNIYMAVPDFQKLYSSHFWAWKNGLKTGIYYLRSKPAKEATKVTIDNNILNKVRLMNEENDTCENCSA